MTTVGKVITCKAAVAWELNSPFSIEAIEVHPPGPAEVRVKIVAASLCHTDVSALAGLLHPLQPYPFVGGHEGAGIVESVGEGVTSVNPGDAVLCGGIPSCGKCALCLDGRTNSCLDVGRTNRVEIAPFIRILGYNGQPNFYCKGQPLYNFMACSCFSEYTVIPENSCIKINPKAPLEKVCLASCGFSTGFGAAAHYASIKPGDATAVWGLGGVGLSAVIGCKDKQAGKIIGIDINPAREDIARKLGCTDFICIPDLKEPLVKVLKEMTNGGLNFGFICVGNMKAMEDAALSLLPGGSAVLIGGAITNDNISVNHKILLYSRTLTGCLIGGYKLQRDIPKLVTRCINGELPIDDLITGYAKLEEINDAVQNLKDGKTIRTVFIL